MTVTFSVKFLVRTCCLLLSIVQIAFAQSSLSQTSLTSTPRQSFTPTPQSVKGYWNIDVVGDFTLPATKSITWSGAGRNLHAGQDWSKLFRRGFSSIEKSRMTPDEVNTDNTKPAGWRSRLSFDQRAIILYQNYFLEPPFNLPWATNSELARSTYFERPAGSANPRESLGAAMSELSGGCVTFGDCPTSGRKSTYSKIYFDIENDGTSPANFQEHANLYVYKMWKLRQVISPNTMIGGITPVPHNSHGYSRAWDYTITAPDWLWWYSAAHIDATDTRGRGMPDAIVGQSFGDLAHFQMPGTYFLSSDLDYNAPHNGDEDRHWLASVLGEQEVNRKLVNKPRIAWQWLFNTQSPERGQSGRAEFPAPPAIAEGMAIFYWFTGAYGALLWDDWRDLTPNAPVVPGRENLDDNRNYSCYEHYVHGLWRLFKHHGDLFNGNEKYLNEDTECSYDGGVTWYRLNANKQKQSGRPFARAIVNGDQILIAATQPYARSGQQTQMMVRYVQDGYRFYTTINLTGDEIFLGRARMPQGNSSFTPSFTSIQTTPTTPTGTALAAQVASYNCSNGAITFSSTGGNGSSVEYSAIGITGWTTNPNHAIEAGLRADPKTMTIRVRQNGVEGTPFDFDMKSYCSGNTPIVTNTAPIVVNPVGAQAATVGTGFSLNLNAVFTDAQTPNQLVLTASGLPAGLSLSGNMIGGTPTTAGVSTVTLRAADPAGLATTTSFQLTVGTAPIVVTPPVGGVLTANVVSYNCNTGVIVFGSTGGNGSTVEYSSIGITGWTANPNQTIEAGLRADPKTMTIRIRQGGVEGTPYDFDMKAYCLGGNPVVVPPVNTAPTVVNPVGPRSATVGVAFSVNVGSVFTDAQTPTQLGLSANGLPAGLNLSGSTISGTPSTSGIGTITLTATDPGGLAGSTSFQLTVSPTPVVSTPVTPPVSTACGSSANTLGQPLQITGIANVNCQTGTFRILTTGGNGSAINYANIVGLNNSDPNNCARVLDNPDLIRAVNNPSSDIGAFGLRVMQNGSTSPTFNFNFKQYCTGAARMATEAEADLDVRVLGNPANAESVVVEIRGTNLEPLTLQVLSAVGSRLSQHELDTKDETVRQTIKIGTSAGLYLLRVSTPTRVKTVKLIRQ